MANSAIAIERYERQGRHWNHSDAYRVINMRLKKKPEAVMFYEGSKRYRGPRSVIRHGMMMPIHWENEALVFIDQQEGPDTPWQ